MITTPSVSERKPNDSLPDMLLLRWEGQCFFACFCRSRQSGLSKACLMFSCKQRKGYLNKVDILSVWLQLRDSKKKDYEPELGESA